MPQTITSIASLGSRYTAGIQYRLFDGTTLGNLVNGTHLGNGIWRAAVELPDAGGEVRWFANAGAVLLGVDSVDALGFTTEQNTKLNELWRKAQLDTTNPVTRTRNLTTGAVTETLGQTGIQIVHAETNDGNTVTSTRQS
jgi:hypothetical protein